MEQKEGLTPATASGLPRADGPTERRQRRSHEPAGGRTAASDCAIELRDLVKTFGPVRALDGLSLAVEPGELHGFLGPNGAGKSTAIRVMLGLLRADSGSATLHRGPT